MCIWHLSIIKLFGKRRHLPLLCNVKLVRAIILLLPLILGACSSEYGECMREAHQIKMRIEKMKANASMFSSDELDREIASLHAEIRFLAKVSGNEAIFLSEIFRSDSENEANRSAKL